MAEVDGALAQSPGACEFDVVGAQHLEHFRSHQAHDQRQLEQPQGHSGQDDGAQAGSCEQPGGPEPETHDFPAPERRQPSERHGEEENKQNAGEEDRQRDADEGNRQE
jgi:hypothetical protein